MKKEQPENKKQFLEIKYDCEYKRLNRLKTRIDTAESWIWNVKSKLTEFLKTQRDEDKN